MTKRHILTDKALSAGRAIEAMIDERTAALTKLRQDADEAAIALIDETNRSVKEQWAIIAKANGLDPEASWGQYRLDTQYFAAFGHMYVVEEGGDQAPALATGSAPVGTMQ